MKTKDVIKSKIYEHFMSGSDFSLKTIAIILGVSILIGLYIYFVYKCISKISFYSRDINITIACIPLVIAAIMISMQANLLVSLGMVGSLSIVRFRNALKNPIDLLFVFWSVSAGIICGVGLYLLAGALCVAMTLLMIVLQAVPTAKASDVLVLRAQSENVDWDKVNKTIKEYSKNLKQKSKNVRKSETEVIYELSNVKDNELISELKKVADFSEINLLSHDGEYRI